MVLVANKERELNFKAFSQWKKEKKLTSSRGLHFAYLPMTTYVYKVANIILLLMIGNKKEKSGGKGRWRA